MGKNICFDMFLVGDPDTKTIIMANNYRSNAPIIMGSNSMIGKNSQRIEKKLVPVKIGGSQIVYFHEKNVQEESGWIADTIGALLKQGFYGRKEIKDVLSYLKMLLHQDDVSFQRTVNEPRRNFGKKRMELISSYAKSHNCSLYEALKANMDQELIKKSKANEYLQLIEKYREIYQQMPVLVCIQRG